MAITERFIQSEPCRRYPDPLGDLSPRQRAEVLLLCLPESVNRIRLQARSEVVVLAMVVGVNRMEATFAERFLYAGADEFAATRTLLADRPQLRSGPRMTVSLSLLDEERRVRAAGGANGRAPGESTHP